MIIIKTELPNISVFESYTNQHSLHVLFFYLYIFHYNFVFKWKYYAVLKSFFIHAKLNNISEYTSRKIE